MFAAHTLSETHEISFSTGLHIRDLPELRANSTMFATEGMVRHILRHSHNPSTDWGCQETSVSHHPFPRTGSGCCLPAALGLLLARAASKQGEEQMAACPFTPLLVSRSYSMEHIQLC